MKRPVSPSLDPDVAPIKAPQAFKRTRGEQMMISSLGRVQNECGFRYTPIPDAYSGYAYIKFAGRKFLVHRVVHVLFNDPFLSLYTVGVTVDHADRNRSNNSAYNLGWASHAMQTANRVVNGQCGEPVASVKRIRGDQVDIFESVHSAAAACGVAKSYIRSAISSGTVVRGFTFTYDVDDVASMSNPGERWVPLGLGKRMLSSHGRLVSRTGKLYTPAPDCQGYCTIRVQCALQKVHNLVMSYFGPPRPSSKHTVDHIGRNRSDNRIESLRWATASEQCRNQERKPQLHNRAKMYESRRNGASNWVIHQNATEAYATTGVPKGSVSAICNPNQIAQRAKGRDGAMYEFREHQTNDQKDIEGEVWKPIDPEDWKEGGVYACLVERRARTCEP